jgi:hypothetical protein
MPVGRHPGKRATLIAAAKASPLVAVDWGTLALLALK